MSDSIERLNKLAEEKRKQRPFAKLDKMEKELNLDDQPDIDVEDSDCIAQTQNKKTVIDEKSIIELSASKQAKFNNQAPS